MIHFRTSFCCKICIYRFVFCSKDIIYRWIFHQWFPYLPHSSFSDSGLNIFNMFWCSWIDWIYHKFCKILEFAEFFCIKAWDWWFYAFWWRDVNYEGQFMMMFLVKQKIALKETSSPYLCKLIALNNFYEFCSWTDILMFCPYFIQSKRHNNINNKTITYLCYNKGS